MAHYLFRLIRGSVVHENEFAACFFHFFTADCSKAVLQRCNSIARTDNNGQSSFSLLIHLQCLQLRDHGKPAKLRDSLHIPKSPFRLRIARIVLLVPLGGCCNRGRKFLNSASVRVITTANAFRNAMRLQELFLPEVRVHDSTVWRRKNQGWPKCPNHLE